MKLYCSIPPPSQSVPHSPSDEVKNAKFTSHMDLEGPSSSEIDEGQYLPCLEKNDIFILEVTYIQVCVCA